LAATASEPGSATAHGAGPGPPLWEVPVATRDGFDPQAQSAANYEFDQRIAW